MKKRTHSASKKIVHKIILTLFASVIFTSSLSAEAFNTKKSIEQYPKMSFAYGYGVMSSPKYEGADTNSLIMAPFLSLKYKNFSLNPISGLRFNIVNQKKWSGGLGAGIGFGRESKKDISLDGLGNLNSTVEGLVFIKYKTPFYSVTSEVAKDILKSGHNGYTVKASIGTGFPLFNFTTFVRPSISITYADKNYLNSFFGVTEDQSMLTGFQEYSLKDELKDISTNLLLVYQISDKVSLNGVIKYKELLGKIAKSPIIKASNQLSGSLSISYIY
jgi:outer membrane scaffolding protein for murein synthesis (MipA/OmpV family)